VHLRFPAGHRGSNATRHRNRGPAVLAGTEILARYRDEGDVGLHTHATVGMALSNRLTYIRQSDGPW